MRFLHPYLLLLLALVIVLIFFTIYRTYTLRKQIKNVGDTRLVKRLMPDLSFRRRLTKNFVLIAAIALLILAAARPQMGTKEETVKRKGIEVMICLDLSNSMLAQDIKPSRLAVAKNIISRLTDKLTQDKVGLIFYTSSAYVQLPITADMVSAKLFLSQAAPSLMPDQGTDISAALKLAERSFSKENDKPVGRSIVLITDAEDHSGNAAEIAKELSKKGIVLNVIGVGSDEGSPIEIPNEGYLRDLEGNMVMSKVNDQLGTELASAGKGIYVRAKNVSGASDVMLKALDELQKAEFKTTVYSAYAEKFAWFLLPALLLIIFDCIYLNRKNRYLAKIKFFDEKTEIDK